MSVFDQPLIASLQPLSRRGLHETVLSQLLLAIRSGQFKQGEHLPEAEIADRLMLSRGTVREAIRRLEQEELVVTQPHRGAFITRLTTEDVEEIFSLRRVLECFAVRLAVPRASDTAMEELAATTRSMVAASERQDLGERVRLDLRFHEGICLLSGNRHLHKTWSRLALKLWLIYFDSRSRPGSNIVGRASSHFELLDLIQRRDVEQAVAWMEDHIGTRANRALADISE